MRGTGEFEGLAAETVAVRSDDGDYINAYYGRPLGPGPFPGMVLFHHRPGWDEWYREITHRFAYHGYATICPDLYHRYGHGSPDDVAARVRAAGDVPDAQVVADGLGCVAFLRAQPILNGKVGLMGTCSGGRHAYLTACRGAEVDAVVDCCRARLLLLRPAGRLPGRTGGGRVGEGLGLPRPAPRDGKELTCARPSPRRRPSSGAARVHKGGSSWRA